MSIEQFVKGLDRFNSEWGKALTIISETCIVCMREERPEMKMAGLPVPYEWQGVKYDYVLLPKCTECTNDPGEIGNCIYGNIESFLRDKKWDAIGVRDERTGQSGD